MQVFDVTSGQQIKTFNEGCEGSCGVAFFADGTLVLYGRRKGGNAWVVRAVGKEWNEVQTIPLPTFAGASARVSLSLRYRSREGSHKKRPIARSSGFSG